jgi:hypothetical protein
MPLEITNKIRSTSIIRVTEGALSANAITANVALTDLSTSNNEVISSASIKGVIWSSNSVIDITRGGEVVLSLHGSGEMRLDDFAYSISKNSDANIEITSSGARGIVILEITKQSTFPEPLVGM